MSSLQFHLGVKSDPILCRYRYPWLFRVLAEEGVRQCQLGTFFELYQLPDSLFITLCAEAAEHGIAISSVFTALRELGGYCHGGDWVGVARRNHERLIEIAALLGARSAGHNPGAVLRDRLGVPELTIEPMRCAAEPPTSPAEQWPLMDELWAYHEAHADTAAPGYCIDLAHGWTGADSQVKVDHWGLLEAGLPWCRELHQKNTDAHYDRTFGGRADERPRGDAAGARPGGLSGDRRTKAGARLQRR